MTESTESVPLLEDTKPAAPAKKRAAAKKTVKIEAALNGSETVETPKAPRKTPSRTRKTKAKDEPELPLEIPEENKVAADLVPEVQATTITPVEDIPAIPPPPIVTPDPAPAPAAESIPVSPEPPPIEPTAAELAAKIAQYPPYQRAVTGPTIVPAKVVRVSNYPPYPGAGVTKIVTQTPPPAPAAEEMEYVEEPEPTPAPGVTLPPYEPVYAEGLVEVSGKGFGFLREPKRNYAQSPSDVFVTPEVIRRYSLRDGQWIKGEVRRGSRGPQLFKLTEINGEDPERYIDMAGFEELTTINPDQRIKLETVPDRYTTRVIDLVTPIGKGQRGLIVAPPRTGKTTLLQHIADGVLKNHPSMKLIILLVDERPEEVTEIRRTVPQAEIMASSNDNDLKAHTRIVQLAIERAKRLVEAEEDVFILLDSITRVARAFNNATAGGGRTGSGGLDTRAMEIPRKLFAAARNTEEAGSLTIIATALIDTGSLMDEVIFQEFKGTGNMELVLDRKIAEQRIYPAVDILKSGTRREELLFTAHDLEKVNTIRRGLAGHRPGEAIERLLSFLKKFPTNSQMLREIPVAQ